MAKISIEKAHGVALDWLVAAALGFEPEREGHWDDEQGCSVITKLHFQGAEMTDTTWSPSTKLEQCREILVSELIAIAPPSLGRRAVVRGTWVASLGFHESTDSYLYRVTANTPELAICRVFCLEKFGPTAEVDDELIGEGYEI